MDAVAEENSYKKLLQKMEKENLIWKENVILKLKEFSTVSVNYNKKSTIAKYSNGVVYYLSVSSGRCHQFKSP